MSPAPSDFAVSLAAARAKGPTTVKSSTVPELSGQTVGLPGWSHFLPQERELSELWIGRQRIETVESMLNHHQVAAIRQVVRLPVHRYVIELDPGELDPVAADLLAADLDVPLLGAPDEQRPGRRTERFSARRHLDRALDALDYGHAVFEQAGRIDAAGYWRLTDLAPIPHWTIDGQDAWEIDRHGRLLKVIQWGCNPKVEIPVDHLVTFTWQGRPGDPRGRSMLRPLTGSWLMSDRTMRVMGMSAERTGMGIPMGAVSDSAAPGAKEAMERLLSGMAAGHDTSFVAEGVDDIRKAVTIMGVTGSTPDLVAMLRYYDESMARAMLAMLLQLGQTETGSRALGVTFDDLLAMFHDTVVDWYCDNMTMQLVERWIDRNRGEDYLTDGVMPRLVWSRREDEGDAADEPESDTGIDNAAPASVSLSRRGRERGTAVAARRQHRLRLATPTKGVQAGPSGAALVGAQRANEPRGSAAADVAASSPGSRRAKATRAAFAATTGRDLRRDPTDVELAAATDFALLEHQFVTAHADLSSVLVRDRDELAAKAIELVEGMATVDPLTLGAVIGPQLTAFAEQMDTGPIVTMLTATASQGVSQVVGEAARQGVTLAATIDYEVRAELEARELLRRLAVQVTETVAATARTTLPAPVGSQSGLFARLRPARFGPLTDALMGLVGAVIAALAALKPTLAEDAAAGATSRANNAGRFEAMDVAPIRSVYASEILDSNTCSACLEVDGTEYANVAEAKRDYPASGYVGCEGRERCRGLAVAIFDDEQPTGAMLRYGLAPVRAAFNPDQPRDEDGKWTDGVGNVMRVALPADRERLVIPPAWTDVMVAADGHEDQPLQAIGTDAKGRTQRRYSAEHEGRQAAIKFQRIRDLDGVIGGIDAELAADTSDEGAALALMRATGMRPGSDSDTGAAKNAYGATNLRVKHVTVTDSTVRLQFTGKSGKDLDFTFNDPELAAILGPRVAGKAEDDRIFNTTPAKVRDRMKAIAPGYKVKDLRTYRGTRVARDLVAAEPVPVTAAERTAARNRIGDAVASVLGNTRAVALNSYIDPAVFAPWDNS